MRLAIAILCLLLLLQEMHRTFSRFGQWGDAIGMLLAGTLFVLLEWPA